MELAVFGTILEQRKEEQKVGRNVVTSQRRDVSANFFSTSLKAKGPRIERRIRKRKNEGTESREAANQISGEDSCFCIFFFPERLLMFDRLIMCITKSSMF